MRRLVIVGSQAFTVEAIDFSLGHAIGVNVFGVVDAGTAVVEEVRRAKPDIVVLDGVSEGNRAFELLDDILSEDSDGLMLLIVGSFTPEQSARALEAGAIVCPWPTAALSRPAQSRREPRWLPRLRRPTAEPAETPPAAPLTSRELEILRLVAEGHTNAWIARQLWVTEQTVKFHLGNAYRKLGVANRTEASQYAVRHGLFGRPEGNGDGPGVAGTAPEASSARST